MKKQKEGNLYDAKMVLNKFSDKNVTTIYDLLSKQPYYVTDLYIKLRQEQSETSQHLKKMRDIGIVSTKKDGKYVQYSTNAKRHSEILLFATRIIDLCPEFKSKLNHETLTVDAAHNILQELWTTQPILNFLVKAKKPHKVGNIYGRLKIEQSVCSQALSRLLDNGIVSYTKNGKEHLYTIDKNKYNNILNEINLFLQ